MKKLVFYIVFAVVGIAMLIAGGYWISQTQSFLDRCVETNGIVVQLNWEPDDEGVEHAYPLFRFVDQATGEEITVLSSSGSLPPAYHIGQEVEVLYDPENPHHATIKSFFDIWGGPLILTSLGSIFLAIGLITTGIAFYRRAS